MSKDAPGERPGSAGSDGRPDRKGVRGRRDAADAAPSPPGEDVTRAPFTQQVGRITLVVLAVLFAVFAVTNSQFVDFNWIFGSTEISTSPSGERLSGGVPLIILLVVSFALGAAVGGLWVWRSGRRTPDADADEPDRR